MGRIMSFLKSTVARFAGSAAGKWIMKPGAMIMVAGKQVWQAAEWTLEAAADVVEYAVDAVDTAVGVSAQAAIHVGQDIAWAGKEFSKGFVEGAGIATRTLGKLAWNNPVSKVARKVGRFMIEDNRPVINADKGARTGADKAMKAAKDMNPAELARVKAEWIKNDPELVREYAGAETTEQREAILGKMSPKARQWVSELSPTDLWAVKKSSAIEIAAHMSGDKAIAGLTKIESYYGATKAVEAAPAAPKEEVKTVTQRRQERDAMKRARREAANGTAVDERMAKVAGQGNEPQPSAQQQVMNFFGPRVAREDEVSPYASASLPTYRPPVPMRRPAMA